MIKFFLVKDNLAENGGTVVIERARIETNDLLVYSIQEKTIYIQRNDEQFHICKNGSKPYATPTFIKIGVADELAKDLLYFICEVSNHEPNGDIVAEGIFYKLRVGKEKGLEA